ncbi:3-octaprenyl-4-hydroxybenzoate carboxy-lyase [Escherichia coli]|uniref:3-octaprenyl-4-hydroxybenzoate carboxy-lyase n=1 Tax=Escherichia coli TaxID=562 RepID=A0A377DC15_ECOLX|nr:3-octaprenyl-4-hydroxybenzoate carboxy-lyase [Escherichia coli]
MTCGTGRGVERSVCADSAKTVPEIVDFYLPPEGCSYRLAVVTIKKTVRRTREARHDGRLVVLTPVYVH